MEYERPYYENLNYRPLLYYVVFGVKGEELNVSRERHHVDEFPDGLNLSFLKKSENSEYMETLFGGSLGNIFDEQNHALFEKIQETDGWVVIQGEVQQDSDLNYMRNAIGFVQALVENNAVGVLDLQTFTLYTPEEWTKGIFEQEFNPYAHVTILASEMKDGSVWLHTRGMRKFGRPDISMENVPKDEIDNVAGVVNQMIYYGVLGVFFSKPAKLHTHNGLSCIVKPEFIDDLNNPDFNNSYYRILWNECETEA